MANRNINPNLASRYRDIQQLQKLETPWGFDMPYSQTDDMFNIGSAIGTLWGANYNQRGLDKSMEEGRKILENYKNQTQPAPEDLNQKYQQATMNEDGTFSMKDAPQKSPFAGQEGMEFKGMPNQPNVSDQIKQGKVGYVFGQGGKYATSDNPTSEGIQVNNDVKAAGGRLLNINPNEWNKDKVVNDLRAELRKQGRNEWQIEEAVKRLTPEFEQYDKEYKVNKGNELYNAFSKAINNNDVYSAYGLMSKLAEIDPQRANSLKLQMEDARKAQLEQKQIKGLLESGMITPEEAKIAGTVGFDKLMALKKYNQDAELAYAKINAAGSKADTTANNKLFNQAKDVIASYKSVYGDDYNSWPDKVKQQTAGAFTIMNAFLPSLNGQVSTTGAATEEDNTNVFASKDYYKIHDLVDDELAKLGDNVGPADLTAMAKKLRQLPKSQNPEAHQIAGELDAQANEWITSNKKEEDRKKVAKIKDDYGTGPMFLGININRSAKNTEDEYRKKIKDDEYISD